MKAPAVRTRGAGGRGPPRWLVAGGLALAIAACSDPEPPSAGVGPGTGSAAGAGGPGAARVSEPAPPARPAPWRVLERFEVGRAVYVRALAAEPAANALWVGTSTGVHEIDLETRTPRRTFTRAEGLANEYVFAIGIDSRGYKWFGTNAGGVSRYRDGEWKTFFPMHGLADYWVYSFGEQRNGTFWIGTWAGVTRVDPVSGDFRNYVGELVNEWVYGIAVDREDRVWFATEGGLSMFDGERWRAWTHEDGLGAPNRDGLPPSKNTGLGTRSRHDLGVLRGGMATYNPSYVFAVLADPDGAIWAGTWGGGLARFDGERFHNLTTDDGLAGDIVYSLARDAEGGLWAGTNRGLGRYDGRTWQRIGLADGLFDEHVYAIAVTPAGEVWAGTRGGVVRLGRDGTTR